MKLLPVATLSLLLTPAPGQTFVVDAANGPGAQFAGIGQALAVVPQGATLLVRPGDYLPFTIDGHDVTMLCEPGARVFAFGHAIVTIENLLASQQVTIRGLRIGSFTDAGFQCWNCQGTVLLDGCRGDLGTSFVGGSLSAHGCDDVRLADCVFFRSSTSACYLLNSNLSGVAGSFAAHFPNAGLFAQHSTIQLSDYQIGNGGYYEAVGLDQSHLRMLGDGWLTTTALGGIGGGGPVISGNGTARLALSVIVDPGTAAPFGPTTQVNVVDMPSVVADTDGPGGLAAAELTGPTGAAAALFLALPAPPTTPWPGLDPVLFAPGTESLQAAGSLQPALQAGYVVPPLPLLRGTRVTWQAATLDPANGLQIANAATYVHY
ncbi:MAG: hypothetical protein KAI24_06315 [Planctomycetes bacterium]|nr:hypothetical protein [Planctomycetota bacterium]